MSHTQCFLPSKTKIPILCIGNQSRQERSQNMDHLSRNIQKLRVDQTKRGAVSGSGVIPKSVETTRATVSGSNVIPKETSVETTRGAVCGSDVVRKKSRPTQRERLFLVWSRRKRRSKQHEGPFVVVVLCRRKRPMFHWPISLRIIPCLKSKKFPKVINR